ATGNKIRGNTIGYNTLDLRVQTDAVGIGISDGAFENEIGGVIPEHGNAITSFQVGIFVSGNSNRNRVQRNIIEQAPIGMLVVDSSENLIGGEITTADNPPGNVFNANQLNILIDGSS